MSTASTSSQSLLEELDLRQNDILDQLEKLNARIEGVLKQCLQSKNPQLWMAERNIQPRIISFAGVGQSD